MELLPREENLTHAHAGGNPRREGEEPGLEALPVALLPFQDSGLHQARVWGLCQGECYPAARPGGLWACWGHPQAAPLRDHRAAAVPCCCARHDSDCLY